LDHLIDFFFIINGNKIGVNYSLFSFLCERLPKFNYQQKKLIISISAEHLNCFISFFDILKGYSFCFEDSHFSSLKTLIDMFEMNYLYQWVSSKVSNPQTLEESLQFISNSYCNFLKPQLHQSLSIITHNFDLISLDDLNQISTPFLLQIFSSESLQVESEDYLFQLIVNLIEKDNNRMILLKAVHFEFVSSHLLKNFFQNIYNDEIDFELFESLKKRLFTDYSDQKSLEKMWKSKPKLISQSGTDELFNVLNSYFQEENNPIEQAKAIIKQNRQLKAELERWKNLYILRTVSFQNDHNGILQHLIHSESNSVSLTCSSFRQSYEKSDNILNYDNSYWFSQDLPNSWVCVQFNSKRILLEGYFLRSQMKKGWFHPQNWILQGSKDNKNWDIIDEQIDIDWVIKDYSKAYFPVETKKAYSYFKFIQTGKSCNLNDHFVLNYVEFFGTIFDQ
jgi:hypothetical protein